MRRLPNAATLRRLPRESEMLGALLERDTSYDGVFLAAVKTTGIFCRPSCPARKPAAKNVEFYSTSFEALQAGYRPCKRCCPLDVKGRTPAWVDGLMDAVDAAPAERLRDEDLRALGVDPAAARRWFRSQHGMTFQAWQRARRLGRALVELQDGGDLLQVGYASGFRSASGFRDAFQRTFGTPPGNGRTIARIVTARIPSPLGYLVGAATERGVALLEFADRRGVEEHLRRIATRREAALVPGKNEHLEQMEEEMAEYFAGTRTSFSFALDLSGTPFQRGVWERLRRIEFGDTMSYERLAQEIGRPGAQRAVGAANGRNPVVVAVPCHRVVQKNGELRGYGGGLWRKRFLLDHELRVLGRAEPVLFR